jgi:hypothetical protein
MINSERINPSISISNFSGRKNDGSSKENYAFSPTQLGTNGRPSGYYWLKSPSMQEAQVFYFYGLPISGRYFVRVFISSYRGDASLNHLNQNIDWNGIMVQRATGSIQSVELFSSLQLYNTRSSLDTGTGGRRVFLGFAGGHGIYNTSQQVCNWPSAVGSVGAGYDGATCGGFPNDLIWGTGNSSNTYDNRSNTWEHWITW